MINWEENYTHDYKVEVEGKEYKIILQSCKVNEDTIEELMDDFGYGEEEIEFGYTFMTAYVDGQFIDYVTGHGTDLTGYVLNKWFNEIGLKGSNGESAERIFMRNELKYSHKKY